MIRLGKHPLYPRCFWLPRFVCHWKYFRLVGIHWLRWSVNWMVGMREEGEAAGWNWRKR